MSPLKPDTRLRNLYNQFLYMDEKAFYDKVRFFEQNESDVFNMNLNDSIWIQSVYLDAVFQIGDYRKYVDKSQKLLQRIVYYNISQFQGEDLYEEVLQKRASSFYHLRKYDDCARIAQELLKINPSRKDTKTVLLYTIRSSFEKINKIIKALFITALFGAAFVLIFYQIVIFSFFPSIAEWFLDLTANIFAPIFLLLISAKVIIDLYARMKVKKWVDNCLENKKKK